MSYSEMKWMRCIPRSEVVSVSLERSYTLDPVIHRGSLHVGIQSNRAGRSGCFRRNKPGGGVAAAGQRIEDDLPPPNGKGTT